jgi:signal transduction histidine kinase/PAS domain-containing protein
MIDRPKPNADDVNQEVKNLIRTLHETEQKLAELTGGDVDAVLHPDGASYLLLRAQGRLRDSENVQRDVAARQSAILNALPAHIALLDSHGVIISVNRAWERFASVNSLQQPSFGIGQNYVDICENAFGSDPNDAQRVADGIRAVLNGAKEEFALDYPCHSETQNQWFRLVVSPFKQDGAGGAVVAHLDITERKLLEEKANLRATKFRALVDALQLLTDTSDVASIIGHAAEIAQNLTDADGAAFEELDADELVYRATSGIAAGFEGLRIKLDSSLSGRAILENRTQRCDDADTDPRVNSTLRDAGMRSMIASIIRSNGKPTGVVKVLARQPNRFDGPQASMLELFAQSFGTILHRKQISSELRIRVAQQAAIAELGRQALTGVAFPVLLNSAAALVASTLDVEYSVVMQIKPDGSSIHFAAGVGWMAGTEKTVVPIGPQTVSGYTLMSTGPIVIDDIRNDARFNAIELLQRHNAVSGISVVIHGDDSPWGSLAAFTTDHRIFLPQDVVFIQSIANFIAECNRRHRLEDQLKQSQRLESVGELTGGIAHDFNNLLTIIRGNSELLVEQLGDSADLRELADMTLIAAKRGAELTHRLLAFARQQPLVPKVLDVNNLVNEIEPLIRRAVDANIEIQFVKANDLWLSLVDPSQLQSAILNLCINARDAMPNGGLIRIETANKHFEPGLDAEDDTLGDCVMVSVSDNGIGIPQENLYRIFDPFFTTKDVRKGTGLGLSMVYGFVKQSHGKITVHSEVGKGTSLKMFLPRSSDALTLQDDEQVSISDLRGTEQILLVEDDDLVRTQAERQLISLGYRVATAPDGPTALGIINQRSDIDLLFTDIIMSGGINGRSLANQSVNIRPGLRVLYTSGYTEKILLQNGRLDDGTLLLSKPYSRVELAQKVREALNSI